MHLVILPLRAFIMYVFLQFLLIILFRIEEREGEQNLLLVFGFIVRNEISRNTVCEGDIPVNRPYERIHFMRRVSERVERTDQASHAGSQNHVHGYSQ